MSENVVWLMRHGQIPQDAPRRFVGQRDLPLDETGRRQAESVRDFLAGFPLTRIVSSDLARAMETSAIVAGGRGLSVEPAPLLREISLGQWEGLTVQEVKTGFPGQYEQRGRDMAGFRPPDGESFADLRDRAWPAFERIVRETDGSLLITAHAGVNRVLLCTLLGMDLADLFRLEQDYACLNAILRSPSGLRLQRFNIPPAFAG
ncbi:MAG: hypothetical protein PWQ57_3236 [Desulfovibrionales bacterium]|nr:hypothetical protein [Desulfovibrionales bacterium]